MYCSEVSIVANNKLSQISNYHESSPNLDNQNSNKKYKDYSTQLNERTYSLKAALPTGGWEKVIHFTGTFSCSLAREDVARILKIASVDRTATWHYKESPQETRNNTHISKRIGNTSRGQLTSLTAPPSECPQRTSLRFFFWASLYNSHAGIPLARPKNPCKKNRGKLLPNSEFQTKTLIWIDWRDYNLC